MRYLLEILSSRLRTLDEVLRSLQVRGRNGRREEVDVEEVDLRRADSRSVQILPSSSRSRNRLMISVSLSVSLGKLYGSLPLDRYD